MPKPYPKEFREDVVRVARNREPGVRSKQVAEDFGISRVVSGATGCDAPTSRTASSPARPRARTPSCVSATPRSGCWSRRTRSCAGRRRICRRRTCRENDVPARPRARRRRDPRHGDVPGAQARPPALLPLARRPGHRRRTRGRPTAPTRCSTPTATTRSSATGSWPTRPRDGRRVDGGPDRVADLLGQRLVVRVRQAQARQERQAAGAAGPRRPRSRRATSPPTAPNQLWLTDITEHRTGEGKLYLCAIKDVFSNRIVGYSIDSRMKSRLAVAALDNAVARRGDVAGCILHSDRGSPVPQPEVRPRPEPPRHGRIDGPGRRRRRQRRHGIASSRCCRRTSSTAAPGPPATSSGSRS